MKLIFGDPKSIAARDDYRAKKLVERIIGIVRCPFCKAPADHAYEVDLENKMIGWNFKCKSRCINSIENCLNGETSDMAETWTDFAGKPILE